VIQCKLTCWCPHCKLTCWCPHCELTCWCYKFSMHVDRSEGNVSFLMQMLLQCHNQLCTSEVNRRMRNIYASDNCIEGFLCYRFPKVALTTLLLVAKYFIHKRFCFIHKAVVCSIHKLTC